MACAAVAVCNFDGRNMSFVRNMIANLSGRRSRSASLESGPRRDLSQGRNRRGPSADIEDERAFRFLASENMLGDIGSEKLLRVIKSFAPSQPTQSIAQFAGRTSILTQVITAIEEHRNHLVLFGGRGTGKTSLALAMASVAKRVGYHCSYVSCTRDSTVASIFRSALTELPIRYDQQFDPRNEDLDPNLHFDALVPEGDISPQVLVDVLSRIRSTRLLIVIDEFDRNENPTLTRDLTEIMKVLSDRAIPVQIVIVGVGDVVDNLVGEHSSIARVLYAVRLTTMADQQIRETLALASRHAGVEMRPEVMDAIVGISYGRPYIARLVGLKAAKMALMRGSDIVEIEDFRSGTDELLSYLDSAGFGHADRFISASATNVSLFVAMLKCKRDSSDRFTISDVCDVLPKQPSGQNVTQGVERAIDLIASPEFGLLTVIPGPVTQCQFVDPRAELCISILCGRALHRLPRVHAPAQALHQ